jgi:hypothetical protein
MTVKDTFTSMADHLRSEYGINDLLTTNQIKDGFNGLHVTNLIDDGQSYDSTVDKVGWKPITGFQKYANLIPGKYISVSCDIEWSGYDPSKGERIGIEYGIKFKNSPEFWLEVFCYPKTSNGSNHIVGGGLLPQDIITGYDEGNFYSIDSGVCKITNPKIFINPMGGKSSLNLLNPSLFMLDHSKMQGTLITFDTTGPTDSLGLIRQNHIYPNKGSSYKLSFEAIGSGNIMTYVFGGTVDKGYQSNGHLITLTNSWDYYEQLIPADNMPLNANFNFSAITNCKGKVADLKLIEV